MKAKKIGIGVAVFIVVLVISSLIFGGSTDYIATVKNSTLSIDESMPIGKAFDHWKECKSVKWAVKKEGNAVYVDYICDLKGVEKYTEKVYKAVQPPTSLVKGPETFILDDQKIIVRFKVDDDTVEPVAVLIKYRWDDGKKYTERITETESIVGLIKSIYKGDHYYPPIPKEGSFGRIPALEEAFKMLLYERYEADHQQ